MQTIANGMPFVQDDAAIGKWEYYDTIQNRDDFTAISKMNTKTVLSNEIYFLPNGEKYWIFEGWTRNYLLVHYGGDEPILCYKYSIEEIDGSSFMFIEIAESHIEVYRKTSDQHFTLLEIGRREDINVPFMPDDTVVGEWYSVGYVEQAENFCGDVQPNEIFWLRRIVFCPDGTVTRVYSDEEWHNRWSKGVLLDQRKLTVSHYFYKTIQDEEYLFLEWKMGNYVYGGMPPSYYVFRKFRK